MPPQGCPLQVFSLPDQANSDLLKGTAAVAIDVLRATTTIITALEAKALTVIPCCSIEQARKTVAKYEGSKVRPLLGGERGGELIEGFDLGNSPTSYSTEVVCGREIVFTTTNGTLAIEVCNGADLTLIGSFVNLSSLCRTIIETGKPISLVCAGTNGEPTDEDLLLAGAVCGKLHDRRHANNFFGSPETWNPTARCAWQMWSAAQRMIDNGETLASILSKTQGGQNLLPLGLGPDIEFASNIDRFAIVPFVDRRSGTVRSDVDLAAQHR